MFRNSSSSSYGGFFFLMVVVVMFLLVLMLLLMPWLVLAPAAGLFRWRPSFLGHLAKAIVLAVATSPILGGTELVPGGFRYDQPIPTLKGRL